MFFAVAEQVGVGLLLSMHAMLLGLVPVVLASRALIFLGWLLTSCIGWLVIDFLHWVDHSYSLIHVPTAFVLSETVVT